MKPMAMLIYAHLAANRDRAIPANEFLRVFSTVDYRSRISEIRKHLRELNSPYRIESKRIKGQRTNEYRLTMETP